MVAAQMYISRPYILELGLKPDLVSRSDHRVKSSSGISGFGDLG